MANVGLSAAIARLTADEFIRRFLLHVLPKRFVRIRHYGLIGRSQCLHQIRPLPATPGCAGGRRGRVLNGTTPGR
jgi:hypothetical protein